MKPEFKRDYNFSIDYEKLFDLLTQGYAIVCYVTWVFSHYENEEPMMATDVCEAKYFDEGPEYTRYQVSCRGTEFFSAVMYQEKLYNKTIKEIFVENCKEYELTYIDPTINNEKYEKNEIDKYKRLCEDEFNKLVCNKTISDFKLDFDNDVDENGMLTADAQIRLNSPVRCYSINKSDFPEMTYEEFTEMRNKIVMEIEKDYEKEETIL